MTYRLVPRPRRYDLSVVLVTALCLGAGAGYRHLVTGPARTTRGLGGHVTLRVPPGWVAEEDGGTLRVARASLGSSPATVQVTRIREPGPAVAPTELDLLGARIEARRAESGHGYRVLAAEERSAFGGHPALFTRYALVRDPSGLPADAPVLPEVVVGVDALVTPSSGAVYHVAAWAPEARFQKPGGELSQVLESVQIEP